jgi:hypothetical protein
MNEHVETLQIISLQRVKMLLIFIGEHSLTGTTTQRHSEHIVGGEGRSRQRRGEAFRDDRVADDSHRRREFARRISSDQQTDKWASLSQRNVQAIGEITPGSAFRVRGLRIGRGLQAGVNGRQVTPVLLCPSPDHCAPAGEDLTHRCGGTIHTIDAHNETEAEATLLHPW